MNAERERITRAFGELPDEAFLYICSLIWRASRESGGMRSESRAALVALEILARRHLQLPPSRTSSEG